jgi:hypothetical protein
VILGTSENPENPAQFYRDPRFLFGLADRALPRTFIWLHRTADGGPVARIDEAYEENPPGTVSRQDCRRRKQEEMMSDHVPELPNVRRDHKTNVASDW